MEGAASVWLSVPRASALELGPHLPDRLTPHVVDPGKRSTLTAPREHSKITKKGKQMEYAIRYYIALALAWPGWALRRLAKAWS